MNDIIIFLAGFLIGSWNEKTRTKAIISELSKLLKKNEVKTDISRIELKD